MRLNEQGNEKNVFVINDAVKQKYVYVKKLILTPYLIPYSKFNLRWLVDLCVKAKIIKLLDILYKRISL